MDPLNANEETTRPHPLSSPVDIVSSKLKSTQINHEPSSTNGAGNLNNNSADREAGIDSPAGLTVPSDDEDLGGVQRLVPDPDSPTSRLLQKAAERSLEAGSKSGTPDKRFSFLHDIARNTKLSQAAQAELHAAASANASPLSRSSDTGAILNRPTAAAGNNNNAVDFLQHGIEIDRQAAVIDQLDADAEEESKINEGMAFILLTRLKAGRTTAERILSILQAFTSAEMAYHKAMELASKVSLVGDCDGPRLRAAMEGFSDIPLLTAATHAAVAESLGDTVKIVQSLVQAVRLACEEIEQGAQSAQRRVQSNRRGIKSALSSHQEACRVFDATFLERKKSQNQNPGGGGGRIKPLEADPWVTEGRLVEQQAALQQSQAEQRKYLAQAFVRVANLERRRVTEVTAALRACLRTYRGAVVSVEQEGERLRGLLSAIDAEGDLDEFDRVATNSVKNGDALSQRQAEVVDHLWRELLSSAEILRQGEVERQVGSGSSASWVSGYAVLTRAGFIHWFTAAKGCVHPSAWGPSGGPTESFNLSKCTFDPGDAAAIRLSEPASGWLGGRPRTMVLRTAEVEDCMDWALDCRELMASVGR